MGAVLASVAALATSTAPAATLTARITDLSGKPLANTVVIAVPEFAVAPQPKPPLISIEQRSLQFDPFIKVVPIGSSVQFPNHDPVKHHVYSFSPAKTFELRLYQGTPEKPIVFDQPGPVSLGCNIHDWMIAFVYVAESPYFAEGATDGSAQLNNLAPGRYVVRVWHPGLRAPEATTRKTIDVAGSDSNVSAAWKIDAADVARVHRSPTPEGGTY